MFGEIFSKDISTESVSPLFSKLSDFLIVLVVFSSVFLSSFYTASCHVLLLHFLIISPILFVQVPARTEYIRKENVVYMFADFVKKVTFTCPYCNTSITFDVLGDDIRALLKVTERLTCPKCLESLSSNALSMAHAIFEYNKAVQTLNDTEINTRSELA